MRVFIIERNEEMDAYDAVTNGSGRTRSISLRVCIKLIVFVVDVAHKL